MITQVSRRLCKVSPSNLQAALQRSWNRVKEAMVVCLRQEWWLHFLNTSTHPSWARRNWKRCKTKIWMPWKPFRGARLRVLNLSQRVWKYVGQYREQLEAALDAGAGWGSKCGTTFCGMSGRTLKDPSRLFRRVRDKRGNLVLSKAAKAFHPGQDVYRSSAKNAARALHGLKSIWHTVKAIILRWQSRTVLSWGLSQKVKPWTFVQVWHLRESWRGRYPKHFKFKGWHPQCMCYAVPILMDEETFDENELGDLKAALRGTQYKRLEAKRMSLSMCRTASKWVKVHVKKHKQIGVHALFHQRQLHGRQVIQRVELWNQEANWPVQQQLSDPYATNHPSKDVGKQVGFDRSIANAWQVCCRKGYCKNTQPNCDHSTESGRNSTKGCGYSCQVQQMGLEYIHSWRCNGLIQATSYGRLTNWKNVLKMPSKNIRHSSMMLMKRSKKPGSTRLTFPICCNWLPPLQATNGNGLCQRLHAKTYWLNSNKGNPKAIDAAKGKSGKDIPHRAVKTDYKTDADVDETFKSINAEFTTDKWFANGDLKLSLQPGVALMVTHTWMVG